MEKHYCQSRTTLLNFFRSLLMVDFVCTTHPHLPGGMCCPSHPHLDPLWRALPVRKYARDIEVSLAVALDTDSFFLPVVFANDIVNRRFGGDGAPQPTQLAELGRCEEKQSSL